MSSGVKECHRTVECCAVCRSRELTHRDQAHVFAPIFVMYAGPAEIGRMGISPLLSVSGMCPACRLELNHIFLKAFDDFVDSNKQAQPDHWIGKESDPTDANHEETEGKKATSQDQTPATH